MAEDNVHSKTTIGVTGMKDGRANTVVAVGQINNNYGPRALVDICSQCKREMKKIENEGDDIWSLIDKQQRFFSALSESRSFLAAKEKLEKKRVVVITGAPDEGKTTLAVKLCHDTCRIEGYNPSYYISPGKLNLRDIGNGRYVMVFDNMFEEINEVTLSIMRRIQGQQENHESTSLFIIVCQLFDKKKAELQSMSQLLKDEYVVNISDINCSDNDSTFHERLKVLKNMKTFLIEEDKIKIANCRPFLFGFVGMCRFYDTAIQISRISYPQAFYFNQFITIMERDLNKASAFLFLIFCEGKINISRPPGPGTQSKLKAVNAILCVSAFDIIKNEFRCLVGTYLKCKEDGVTEFMYPVLYDSCVAAAIACYPQDIWEHCKVTFRDDTTEGTFVRKEDEAMGRSKDVEEDRKPTSQEPTVIISKSTVNLMAENLANTIKSKQFCDALKNPLLQNEDFRESLFRTLEPDLPHLVKETDKRKGGNFLFWSADSGNKPLISNLLNLPDLSTSELNQSIVSCAERNSISALESLKVSVEEGTRSDLKIDINCKIADETPIMVASTHGHAAMVKHLLEMGADLSETDRNGRNCVHLAAVRDDVDTYEILRKHASKEVLNSKDDNGFTPNMIAFDKKSAVFEYNYPHSDASGVTDGGRVEEENVEIQELPDLRMSKQDIERIHSACVNDSETEIRTRLSRGTLEINEKLSNGNTSVMIAAYYGSHKVFKLLVNEPGCDVSLVNVHGCNILHNACIGGSVDIVELILDHDKHNSIDMNLKNKKGRTPVMEAAYIGHTFVFNLLVSKGCDISGQDCEESTILHMACMGGSANITEYILSQNTVDIYSKNTSEKTPLAVTSEHGHHDVAKLLKSHIRVLNRHLKKPEGSPHKRPPREPSEKGGDKSEAVKKKPPPVPPKPKVMKGDKSEAVKKKPPPVPPKPKVMKKKTDGLDVTERKTTQRSPPPELPSTPATLPTSATPASAPPTPLSQSMPSLPPSTSAATTSRRPPPPPRIRHNKERPDRSGNQAQTDRVKPDRQVEEELVYTITDLVSKTSLQVSCPAMTLHKDRVCELLDVSEDGHELTNTRESGRGHHSDQFKKNWGTCSGLIPLPSSPSTLTVPTYWETNTRVQVRSKVPWCTLLVMGVMEESQVDKDNRVYSQTRGWCVRVGYCNKHHGWCTQVWGEGRQCGECLTDTLTDTPDIDVILKYGVVVDIGRGRLAFIDLNRERVLYRFDVVFRDSLRPMFSVPPFFLACITMRLISGREIVMDDKKKSLISEALSTQ